MLLLVHGGAGTKKPTRKALRKLSESLSAGYEILLQGGSSLNAVIESIKVLEDSGIFNAGLGANYQLDGIRRLDASLMDGKELRAGSVIGLEGIRNPVMAARSVMDLPHVMLTNVSAKRIAASEGIAALPATEKKALDRLSKVAQKEKGFMQLYKRYFSTVGAVALDGHGDLAAGASTGGISAMLPGRVGDTPIIGAGVYAENPLGAISCTGIGEYIIRLCLAKEICMNLKDMTPLKSATVSLKRISQLGGEAGIILLNAYGQFTIMHTTEYMPSGYANRRGLFVKEGFNKIPRSS